MKTKIFTKITTNLLVICAYMCLCSCSAENIQTEEPDAAIEVFFSSSSQLGNVELFVFDKLGFFAGSWHREKSEPFSIMLKKDIYTFIAWSNVSGIFVPQNPVIGVTKIGNMSIVRPPSEDYLDRPIFFGIDKDRHIQGSGIEIISLSEFNVDQSFDIAVTGWDTIISDNIIM